MAKPKEVRIHVDRPFTYRLNKDQKRTLPIGWRGCVPAEVGKQLEVEGKGRVTGENADKDRQGEDGGAERKASTGEAEG